LNVKFHDNRFNGSRVLLSKQRGRRADRHEMILIPAPKVVAIRDIVLSEFGRHMYMFAVIRIIRLARSSTSAGIGLTNIIYENYWSLVIF
jgi:hypothetical protein